MADLKEIGKQAKAARYILAGLDTDTKNKALFTAAECLEADAADILAEKCKRIWKPDAAAACRKGCLTGSL